MLVARVVPIQFRLETPGVACRSDGSVKPESLAELGFVSAYAATLFSYERLVGECPGLRR